MGWGGFTVIQSLVILLWINCVCVFCRISSAVCGGSLIKIQGSCIWSCSSSVLWPTLGRCVPVTCVVLKPNYNFYWNTCLLLSFSTAGSHFICLFWPWQAFDYFSVQKEVTKQNSLSFIKRIIWWWVKFSVNLRNYESILLISEITTSSPVLEEHLLRLSWKMACHTSSTTWSKLIHVNALSTCDNPRLHINDEKYMQFFF